MDSWSNIKGQDRALKFLLGSLSSGRMSNSYLFLGPEGVGRVLTAKTFIKTLVCACKNSDGSACMQCPSCRRIEAGEHPDILWIKPEKNKAIKIDEVRKAKEMLSLKPYEAPMSVCVIEDAHMMTQEAQNALLKVLEEPPGYSLLVLVTHKKELLLDTVISRCSEVNFHFLSVDDTKDLILKNTDTDEETAIFMAYFSGGSPGRAISLIDEDLWTRREEIIALLEDILKEEDLFCMNWDTDKKNNLVEDIEMLILLLRDIAMAKEGLRDQMFDKKIADSSLFDRFRVYTPEKIYKITEKLINMRLALTGNVNPKLVAQVLPGQFE